MALDPEIRPQVFKTLRLWLLALVCASVGSYVVWRTNDLGLAIAAFLLAFAAFGLPLWAYERWLRNRSGSGGPRG